MPVQSVSQIELISQGLSEGPARLAAWAPAQWAVAPGWAPLVRGFFDSATGRDLGRFVQGRLSAGATIYPPQPLRALELTPPEAVRVVILGQDPYHGPGQAEGLAFSVAPGMRLPPSLRNIHQELARGFGPVAGATGSLIHWARQGVLLLNTCLTVEDGCPASHAGKGWEVLTDLILKAVAQAPGPIVFMLWGGHAQRSAAAAGIGESQGPRLVLRANHPSPLSARRPPQPFLGCGHFQLANEFLQQQAAEPIRWSFGGAGAIGSP